MPLMLASCQFAVHAALLSHSSWLQKAMEIKGLVELQSFRTKVDKT